MCNTEWIKETYGSFCRIKFFDLCNYTTFASIQASQIRQQMYKIKCPVYKGTHTVKNGKKKQGIQLYICTECGYQFHNRKSADGVGLWSSYLDGKQAISGLVETHGMSQSSITRRLREMKIE